MTTHYTSITLYGVEQNDVLTWCENNHVTGYVSPTIDDVTVLYENTLAEHAADEKPMEYLLARGAKLSGDLLAAAMVAVVADDDLFMYVLYLDGQMIDHYMSYTTKPPVNGSVAVLRDTFDAEGEEKRIEAALRREGILSAADRHKELMDALALPPMMVDMGFDYLDEGEKPHGVEDNNDVAYIGWDVDEDEDS
ncbi:MAG: hypothetical protein AAF787_06850 [Chloroflexota bacterium]